MLDVSPGFVLVTLLKFSPPGSFATQPHCAGSSVCGCARVCSARSLTTKVFVLLLGVCMCVPLSVGVYVFANVKIDSLNDDNALNVAAGVF